HPHLAGFTVKEWMLNQPAFVKPLKDVRMRLKRIERVTKRLPPRVPGKILAKNHTAAAPGFVGKTADLQDQIAVSLAEIREFHPVMNLQAWQHRVVRQRSRIHDPRIRKHVAQSLPMIAAKFPPPEVAQRLHPEN